MVWKRWNFRFLQVFLGELEDAVCTSSAIEEMDEHDEDDDDEDVHFFLPRKPPGERAAKKQRQMCVCVYVDKIVVIDT